MKTDILNKQDVEKIVDIFFDRMRKDPLLGAFFTEYYTIDWEKHLRIMTTFWENILFYTGEYDGNPMQLHKNIHREHPLDPAHFTRWIDLLSSTADDLFEGPNTETLKQKAKNIALVLQIKLYK